MLAFSIDYYGIFFGATQSVELFCTYLIPTCDSLHLTVNTRDWTCTSKISAMLGTQNDCPACSNAGRTVI